MNKDSQNVINLNLKKGEKNLNFSDFQKQNIKFDILKLQEAYKQIIQTKNLMMVEAYLILVQYV